MDEHTALYSLPNKRETMEKTVAETKQDEKQASLGEMSYTDLQVRERLEALEAELDDNGGAFVTDENATEEEKWDLYENLVIRLDNLSETIKKKIDRTHYVIGKISAEAESANSKKKTLEKTLTKPLLARRKRLHRQVDRLKNGIIAHMDGRGQTTIEGATCRYTIVERDTEKVRLESRDVAEAPQWLTRRVIDEEKLEQALRGDLGSEAQKEAQRWGRIEVNLTRFLRVS